MRCATSSPLNSARPSRESRSADEMWGMDGAGLAAMRGWSLVGIHGELEGRVRCGAFASAMPYVALRGALSDGAGLRIRRGESVPSFLDSLASPPCGLAPEIGRAHV